MNKYGKFVASKDNKSILVSKKGYIYNLIENKLMNPFIKNQCSYINFNNEIINASEIIMNTFIGKINCNIIFKDMNPLNIATSNISYDILNISKINDSYIIEGKVFKHIPSVRSYYYISNDGIVYNSKYNKFMIKSILKNNSNVDDYGTYEVIGLIPEKGYTKGKLSYSFIHRLVYDSFIGIKDTSNVIDHLDSNKRNNFYLNLEEVSQAENIYRASINGLCGNSLKKFSIDSISTLCMLMEKYDSLTTIDILKYIKMPVNTENQKSICSLIKELQGKTAYQYISLNYNISNFKIERNPKSNTFSKLSENDIFEILKLNDDNYSIKDISVKFNVSPITIQRIVNGETWKYIYNTYKNV